MPPAARCCRLVTFFLVPHLALFRFGPAMDDVVFFVYCFAFWFMHRAREKRRDRCCWSCCCRRDIDNRSHLSAQCPFACPCSPKNHLGFVFGSLSCQLPAAESQAVGTHTYICSLPPRCCCFALSSPFVSLWNGCMKLVHRDIDFDLDPRLGHGDCWTTVVIQPKQRSETTLHTALHFRVTA